MTLLRPLLLAAAVVLAPLAAAATDMATARKLLDLVDFRTYSADVSRGFEGVPDAPGSGLAPEVIEKWPDIVADRIDAGTVYAAAAEAVAAQLSDDDAATLIAFFETPVGQRVTAAEAATQDVADPAALARDQAAYLAGLDESFRDRFALYQELIDAMHAVDSGTALAMNINFSLISGMIASGLMEDAPSDAEILAMLAEGEAQVRAGVFAAIVEGMAYAYRDIPDDDMRAYADLLASPPGRRLYAVIQEATDRIVVAAAREIGHEIMVQTGKRDI